METEAIFQSLGPSFDAPVLSRVAEVLYDLLGLPVTPGAVDVL